MKRSLASILLAAALFVPAAGSPNEAPKLVLSDQEKTLLELTNKARARQNLPPLQPNPLLFRAARAHSTNMVSKGQMSHVLDDTTPAQRIQTTGYRSRWVGENIAWSEGGEDLANILKMWLNSRPHRENILNATYTEIGLGLARDRQGAVYYTQVFAAPRAAAPLPENQGQPRGLPKLELSATEKAVLELTNKARAEKQLPPLRPNPVLSRVARAHSANMARKGEMNHVLETTPAQRIEAAGYRFLRLGENIALWPGDSAVDVMRLWLNSPGHRANLLNPDYTEIGLGVARDDKGAVYYTQVFATPNGE